MSKDPTTDEFLEYLQEWRTYDEIEIHFGMTRVRTQHLLRWSIKAKLVDVVQLRVPGEVNRVWFYKSFPS
jgi:hypothetical protein